jgi:glycerol-3-phosphate dehydrogenase subunit B
MKRSQHYDAVVIGAGTAGMTAAVRLAESGAQVIVLAKGIGSTNLAPGTIDVAGYVGGKTVESPLDGAGELARVTPIHPYSLLDTGTIRSALEWFKQVSLDGPQPGYGYVGDLDRNYLLPTALGALKPSALVPETFAAGDARSLGRVLVVGLQGLRDFHPALCAANLETAGIAAESVMLTVELDRADANTLTLAQQLDDPAWRTSFAGKLAGQVRGVDQVALPAVLGLRDPHGALSELQERLGRPVFEVGTLPPSVPGMRLFEIFRSALVKAGGRLVLGGEVIGHTREGDRITAVQTASAGSPTTYSADAFVLATGGFHSGGITLDSSWHGHETVFDLSLQGLPGPEEPRFVDDYFAEQPSARAGVAVTADLHAADVANVLVAGAALPGAIPAFEGCGEGIALASGYRAAETLAATHLGEGSGSLATNATV